jgi:hypothetical protein
MKYMMFVATDPEAEPFDPALDNAPQWADKYDASGQRVMGDRLRRPNEAKTVRRRSGEVLVTDGPFAETREWIAGFDILECETMDEAVAIAAEHPMARFGRLEVRAFWPFDEPG